MVSQSRIFKHDWTISRMVRCSLPGTSICVGAAPPWESGGGGEAAARPPQEGGGRRNRTSDDTRVEELWTNTDSVQPRLAAALLCRGN